MKNKEQTSVIYSVVSCALLAVVPMLAIIELGRAVPIALALIIAYLVPSLIYVRSHYYNAIGLLSMSVAFIVLSTSLALNLHQLTVEWGSIDSPFLLHDPRSFYNVARAMADNVDNRHLFPLPYMGYSYFISLFFKMGIYDIAYPIVVNIFIALCTIVFTGRCVYFVVEEKNEVNRISGYAMMLTSMIPGFIATAPVLQKDVFVTFSLLLCIGSMYALKQRYKPVQYTILFVLALIMLAYMRATYIFIVMIFTALVWLYRLSKREIVPFVLLLVFQSIIAYVGLNSSWWEDASFIECYVAPTESISFYTGESQEPLEQLIGPYNTYPIWVRLILLPITVAVQFMIPLPFETVTAEFGMPPTNSLHRMSYLWYMAAIPMLSYYLFYWWRKNRGGVVLSLFALGAGIAYCIPAFISGGTVSRYAFCFVPLLSVVGAYVICRALRNKGERKPIAIFSILYIILVIVALYIAANPHIIL